MSANINDASAIQALLDQLKSSDVWRQVTNPSVVSSATDAREPLSERPVPDQSTMSFHDENAGPQLEDAYKSIHVDTLESASSDTEASANLPSVASLLSQLQSSKTFDRAIAGTAPPSALAPTDISLTQTPYTIGRAQTAGPDIALAINTHPRAPQTPPEKLRACSFQQALPHLARLTQDPEVLRTLATMKSEQIELERQLWNERREIQRKHEERVRTARTKANIIGAGLTQYEADAMTDSFRTELRKFDRMRVLPAWDGLVTKQQIALEALGVPAMFPSTESTDRERQQKIMQVLDGVIGSEAGVPPLVDASWDGHSAGAP